MQKHNAQTHIHCHTNRACHVFELWHVFRKKQPSKQDFKFKIKWFLVHLITLPITICQTFECLFWECICLSSFVKVNVREVRQGITRKTFRRKLFSDLILQDGNIDFEIIYPKRKKMKCYAFRQTLMSHIPPPLIFLHDKFPDIIVKSQAECNWQL